MSKIIQIASNPVVAMLRNADHDVKVLVSTLLSYYVDGYQHTESYQTGSWDGRSTFFTYTSGKFPVGFLTSVETELRKNGYTVQHIRRELPSPVGPENPIVDTFSEEERYSYQRLTVKELVKRGIMIARVATGGGKSRIAKLAYAQIKRRTIFITTRKVLMYQMKAGFESAGWKVGVIGDGEWNPRNDLTVAMVQTLMSRLKEPLETDFGPETDKQRSTRQSTIEYLSNVEFVIGEEAHEVGGEGYFNLMSQFKSAAFRLALTATPFMKDNEEANMRLLASFGAIGVNISEKLLIDSGILAKPIFKFLKTPQPPLLRRGTPWQKAQEVGIMENIHRNKQICAEAIRAARYGLSAMILVQRKAHGTLLKTMLLKAGIRADYIFGDSANGKREAALSKLKNGKIDVLIGSTILDVGVDVPAVGIVIMAGGGKAEVTLRQRIGRGLREKKIGPNVCLIVDFEDGHNKYLASHAKTRRSIIEKTPGFGENILPVGVDFNYPAIGFSLKMVA